MSTAQLGQPPHLRLFGERFFFAVKLFLIPVKVSEALGDKLYMSPALETASWCNESGYVVHLYLHPILVLLE